MNTTIWRDFQICISVPLRFLINTYEGPSFQKRCRQVHATHRIMKSLHLKNLMQNINASFLCQDEIQTSSNRAKT